MLYNMNKLIGKKFSGAAHITKLFLSGFKEFSKELGMYVSIKSKVMVRSSTRESLTRKELELYYRFPKELKRVAPTILISALPFMNYVMFPIAYYYPKHLLSSHFWSVQQKSEFPVECLKERQKYYKPVFRILQSNLFLIQDERQRDLFQNALYKIGSGSHPSSKEILEFEDFFSTPPFSLKAIHGPHAENLCLMHGIHGGWFRRKRRLTATAQMIQDLDIAIMKEGISEMEIEEKRMACFLRGLNGANASEEEMNEYINDWVHVTTSLSSSSHSLILHLPIFLSYNNPVDSENTIK